MKAVVWIASLLVIAVVACQKEVSLENDANLRALGPGGRSVKHDSTGSKPADSTKSDTVTVPPPPFPQHTANNDSSSGAQAPSCPALLIYGDTIVFPQPTASDDIIKPVNNPGAGKYFSWPVGMVLDQNTGAIDLTQSQTGMRYIMGFVPAGTKDTCLSTLIIGGAAYFDSVYVFADSQTMASPYFEANPYLPSPCANGGCTFDVTGSAAAQKVIVNKTTGVIDLQKTLNGTGLLGGAFGLLPVSGSSITTTIYYKINYGSNNALQQIQVQLMYYDKKSLIGAGLLGGLINKVNNVFSGNIISTSTNPRPPLVIMTRYN